MIRQIAAVAVVLLVSSPVVSAQSADVQPAALIVKTPATVYKSPTTASPSVGRASAGTVLEVTRHLGSWVQVPWPEGESGHAYIHVSTGTIAPRALPDAGRAAATASLPSPAAPAASAAPPAAGAPAEPTIATEQPANGEMYVSLPRHMVGLGGQMNPEMPGFGGSARAWWNNRLGVQFEMSRSRVDTASVPGHVTSLEFNPSVLYALPDGLMASLWLRPYVGGGASFYRATSSDSTGAVANAVTEKGLGFQTFGGVEATFAGAPRFAVSADLGYRWSHTTVGGLAPDKLGFSLAGHWYIK